MATLAHCSLLNTNYSVSPKRLHDLLQQYSSSFPEAATVSHIALSTPELLI
jgi:hypothetical protein